MTLQREAVWERKRPRARGHALVCGDGAIWFVLRLSGGANEVLAEVSELEVVMSSGDMGAAILLQEILNWVKWLSAEKEKGVEKVPLPTRW